MNLCKALLKFRYGSFSRAGSLENREPLFRKLGPGAITFAYNKSLVPQWEFPA